MESITKKKDLLFSDDFERAELGMAWVIVLPTYALENRTLKGTPMRFNAQAVKGHQALIKERRYLTADLNPAANAD